MRSNPLHFGTSLQLAAEVYHHCRAAGIKCVLKYTDASNDKLKANLVACDNDWNIKAVGIFGTVDKPTEWDVHHIPVVRFYSWEDARPAAKAIVSIVKGE